MTIVTYSTIADNNDALAPENTMVVEQLNDALREVAADVRGFGNELCWYRYGDGNGDLTPERLSGTSFRVAADLRAVYAVGMRVRATGTVTGDITGVITSTSFLSPNTTVSVEWDSGSLAAEAIVVYVSTVRPAHIPALAGQPLQLTNNGERIEATTGLVDVYSGYERIARFTPEYLDLLSNSTDDEIAPRLRLVRRSATPVAFDRLGGLDFFGHDAGLSDQVYARMVARPTDVTIGDHGGLMDFYVAEAGVLTKMLRVRPEVVLITKDFSDETTSGGIELHSDGDVWARDITVRDVTADSCTIGDIDGTTVDATTVTATTGALTTVNSTTVNATTAVNVNGVAVAVFQESAETSISSTQMTAAHGLGARPKSIGYKLRCNSTEHGYSSGDDTHTVWQTSPDAGEGATVWADATNVGLSITATDDLRVVPKAGGAAPEAITPANWRVVFVYSA